jgi:hypothetical protein
MEIPSDEIDEIDAKVATFSFDANDEPDEEKCFEKEKLTYARNERRMKGESSLAYSFFKPTRIPRISPDLYSQ